MPNIRAALFKLKAVNVAELVDGHKIAANTLYATISGERKNELAKLILADALGLHQEEMFPPDDA